MHGPKGFGGSFSEQPHGPPTPQKLERAVQERAQARHRTSVLSTHLHTG